MGEKREGEEKGQRRGKKGEGAKGRVIIKIFTSSRFIRGPK